MEKNKQSKTTEDSYSSLMTVWVTPPAEVLSKSKGNMEWTEESSYNDEPQSLN